MSTTRKTVLITGCSAGGAGAAFASVFAQHGYHVFATARTPSKIPESLHSNTQVTVLTLDVTSSDSIATAATLVTKVTGGKLDVLINNAGMGMSMPLLDMPIEEGRKMYDLNFWGPLAMMQAFGELLISAKGCVVNNASVGGLIHFPFTSMYCSSKAALISASESWRRELAPLSVRVIALVAGGIDTKFLANMDHLIIPDTSHYISVKDEIEHPDQPEKNAKYMMNPEAFALQLLRKIEGGATGKVWLGGGVGVMKFLLWLLPRFILDPVVESVQRPFSKKLTAAHKEKENTTG